MSTPRTVKVAAVQPALRLAEPDWNMKRCEDLVRAAAKEHNPDVIILPEAFTCPNVYDKRLKSMAVPVDGAPYQMLKTLARELGPDGIVLINLSGRGDKDLHTMEQHVSAR